MTSSGPVDLAAIKERLAKATPGPWFAHFTVHGDPSVVLDPHRASFTAVVPHVSTASDDYGRADAEFIANAPTDIAALLAEVERWRQVVVEENLAAAAARNAEAFARADSARLLGIVEAVTALHHAEPNPWWAEDSVETRSFGPLECAHDYKCWPCPTAAALAASVPSSGHAAETEDPLRCVHELPLEECDGPDAHIESEVQG